MGASTLITSACTRAGLLDNQSGNSASETVIRSQACLWRNRSARESNPDYRVGIRHNRRSDSSWDATDWGAEWRR